MKRKRCKICKDLFMPRFSTIEPVCGWKCAIAYNKTQDGKKATDKAYRADKRERKEKLKTKAKWLSEAQTAFNKWIRHRDRDLGCICCGRRVQPGGYRGSGRWDAGHYLTVASHPELRFNPDNCHKQRARPCNSDKSGNQAQYRKGLVKKIGIERVLLLEGPHPPKHYTIVEIQEIKAKYQKLNKENQTD